MPLVKEAGADAGKQKAASHPAPQTTAAPLADPTSTNPQISTNPSAGVKPGPITGLEKTFNTRSKQYGGYVF